MAITRRQSERAEELRLAAKRILARELGLSFNELERRAKEMARVREELPTSMPLPAFDRAGVNIGQHDLIAIASVRHAYDEITALLHRVGGLVRALRDSRALPVNVTQLGALNTQVAALAKRVYASRPTEACLACKRIPDVQAECVGCWGTGWVSAKGNVLLPAELLAVEPPMVRFRGAIITARRA